MYSRLGPQHLATYFEDSQAREKEHTNHAPDEVRRRIGVQAYSDLKQNDKERRSH